MLTLQGGMISPTPVDNTSPNEEDGASDLDFGPLRRSSPHVCHVKCVIAQSVQTVL